MDSVLAGGAWVAPVRSVVPVRSVAPVAGVVGAGPVVTTSLLPAWASPLAVSAPGEASPPPAWVSEPLGAVGLMAGAVGAPGVVAPGVVAPVVGVVVVVVVEVGAVGVVVIVLVGKVAGVVLGGAASPSVAEAGSSVDSLVTSVTWTVEAGDSALGEGARGAAVGGVGAAVAVVAARALAGLGWAVGGTTAGLVAPGVLGCWRT